MQLHFSCSSYCELDGRFLVLISNNITMLTMLLVLLPLILVRIITRTIPGAGEPAKRGCLVQTNVRAKELYLRVLQQSAGPSKTSKATEMLIPQHLRSTDCGSTNRSCLAL